MKEAVTRHMASPDYRQCDLIYTDGSVTTEGMTAGAAVVWGSDRMSWSLPTPCSSTMAELAAIRQALRMVAKTDQRTVAILTDSKAAIQAINTREPRSHVALVMTIQHIIASLQERGRRVNITWIPGHANIQGNVRADTLARTATLSPLITLHLPLQRTAITSLVRRHELVLGTQEHRRQLAEGSPWTRWYQLATQLSPTTVTTDTPRWLATTISRLRLGYPCSWEIIEGRSRECTYCGQDTPEGLLHYVLDCDETQRLRTGGPDVTGLQRRDSAATIVRHIVENAEDYGAFLQEKPPPR